MSGTPLWGRKYQPVELIRRVGRLEQAAGVRLVTLADGVGRGIRVLEFRTGAGFAFDVLVDRGFDVGRCELRGVPLAWISPNGPVGPWFHEPREFGWLRSFAGGLLTTCGLAHVSMPADDAPTHASHAAMEREHHPLHGRVANLPARLLGYGERADPDGWTLWAEGEVTEAAVFGAQLTLRRRIEARVGAEHLLVRDRVGNAGFGPSPHMLLYHVNVGHPVVDAGSRVVARRRSMHARGAVTTKHPDDLDAPTTGASEEVWEQDLVVDDDGRASVAVVNPKLSVGVYQRYSAGSLPHHRLWRMLGEGTYVVGIEPSTNRIASRADLRDCRELIVLEPGQQRDYELELGALVGDEQIGAFLG